MAIKEHEYIRQTLERYTNCDLHDFCEHVLITNFKRYIHRFRDKTRGEYFEGNFRIVNAKDINVTMIDFGIGSRQAALLIHCLTYLENINAVIMLGMCGGIDDTLEIGDFVVPIGSIMLVSDMPLMRKGIKDKEFHEEIYAKHMEAHLDMGLDAMEALKKNWGMVERRLSSEW